MVHAQSTNSNKTMSKDVTFNAHGKRIAVCKPATTAEQRGGVAFDRFMVRMATSKYLPHRAVEVLILLSEVFFLNLPEWIFGEYNRPGTLAVTQRIATSISNSRMAIMDTISKGGQRKVAVITGGASGLGLETALSLAEAGYHLIIGDRATALGIQAVEYICKKTNNMHVEFIFLDLGSFAEIKKFARQVQQRTTSVALLINNAGVMALPKFRPTVEGYDSQFGVNYLGHAYLTHLLLPSLQQAPKARIVNTASSAHYGAAKISYESLTNPKKYDQIQNYCASKLATVLYTRWLAKKLATEQPNGNVTVNCLHPGACHTALFNHSLFLRVLTTIGLQVLLKSAERGARTIKYLALSEEVEGISGQFFMDERIRQPNPASYNDKMQQDLERFTTKALGLSSPLELDKS